MANFNSNGNDVNDSTDLAALVVPPDVAPGTKVWNVDVGAYFTYTISTAALVPDEVVEVAGITGARWIVDPAVVIPDGSITLAKMANLAAGKVIGRATGAGTGVPTALTGAQQSANLALATFAAQGAAPFADPWYSAAFADALALGCTEFLPLPPRFVTAAATAPTDAKVDGGGIPFNSAALTVFPTTSVLEAPKSTAIWYFKYRAKQFSVSTAGQYVEHGLAGTGGLGAYFVEANGTNTGKYYTVLNDGSQTTTNTNVTVDTSFHDFAIYPSGSNIIFAIDGTIVTTVANTHMGNVPASLQIVNGGVVTGVVTKLCVGFVSPV